MMARAEFDVFWIPKLNEVLDRKGLPHIADFSELDSMWLDYLFGLDGGLQERAEAIVARGKSIR